MGGDAAQKQVGLRCRGASCCRVCFSALCACARGRIAHGGCDADCCTFRRQIRLVTSALDDHQAILERGSYRRNGGFCVQAPGRCLARVDGVADEDVNQPRFAVVPRARRDRLRNLTEPAV